METIHWSVDARNSLREIYHYIAGDNPTAAANVVDGIKEKVKILENHSRIGWRYLKITNREIRILLYGRYRIVYEIQTTGVIQIVDIIHAAMDMDRRLK